MTRYIVLDVGGTTIKGNVVTQENELFFPEEKVFDACSDKTREEVLLNFLSILNQLNPRGDCVQSICFAFPGPFDYARGISYMKGLSKYEALYGLEMQKTLQDLDETGWIKTASFHFVHDIEAFAYGICRRYPYLADKRVFCLCLGTGAGSAFLANGTVVKGTEGVPENGWIYNVPYKESIIDDYISARGLARLSKEKLGTELDGYHLKVLADNGDERAVEVFLRFGEEIGSAIQGFLNGFHPQVLVLGGNLAKAYSNFQDGLHTTASLGGIEVLVEHETSVRVFEGLLANCMRRK
jgi:glucokinase